MTPYNPYEVANLTPATLALAWYTDDAPPPEVFAALDVLAINHPRADIRSIPRAARFEIQASAARRAAWAGYRSITSLDDNLRGSRWARLKAYLQGVVRDRIV